MNALAIAYAVVATFGWATVGWMLRERHKQGWGGRA